MGGITIVNTAVTILVRFLEDVAAATELADVNIAAGVAAQAIERIGEGGVALREFGADRVHGLLQPL